MSSVSMPCVALRCMLLFAFMHGSALACMLKNHTIRIERQDCVQCMAINTTICSGYCYTQDTNLKGRFGRSFLIQHSCVPLSLVYQAANVSGCPQDVNPQLYYPVAHRCSCRRCNRRIHNCVSTSQISYDGCTTSIGGAKTTNLPAVRTRK